MSPTRRRDAVQHLMHRHKVSERRACRVVGQQRSTQRYVGVPVDFEVRLVKAMSTLAEQNPRYCYRRIHALLVADGWAVNIKRVERIWRAEGLRMPPRRSKYSGKKAGGDAGFARVALERCTDVIRGPGPAFRAARPPRGSLGHSLADPREPCLAPRRGDGKPNGC